MNEVMTNSTTAEKKVALAMLETSETDNDLRELGELAATADLTVAITFTQKRPNPDSGTYFGSGKVAEIKDTLHRLGINTIIFNDELSPIQHANLTDELNVEVMDRTNLILHIFSLHARTAEGKIQVELARLKYALPRLRTLPGELSRQGAGVLARGPGETKLEMDKRYIRDQIHHLKQELADVERQRSITRTNREESHIPLIALVGYTNAGKSTLFNALTGSAVLAENKLFATLDTTIRRTELTQGLNVLFGDTVGFIKNLPHHLVESFKSTLEETVFADIILNVCDASDSQVAEHIEVTRNQLNELKVNAKIIDVYNKCDLINGYEIPKNDTSIGISALNGSNIDALKRILIDEINKKYAFLSLQLPYSDMKKLPELQAIAYDTALEYNENGVKLTGNFLKSYNGKYSKYILGE